MESEHNLRFEFVGMLFALAIGQVAIECGDLTMKHRPFWDDLHIYAHLLLGTVIIATSWVGWQTSHSFGNTRLIRSNFSLQFVILLVDIFLVICYFIVVRGAEEYYKVPSFSELDPDGENQTFWTMVIFAVFFVWDGLTKLVIPYYDKKEDPANGKSTYTRTWTSDKGTFFRRGLPTFVCFVLAILAYLFMRGQASSLKIVYLDFVLISIFVFFRGWKEVNAKTRDEFLTETEEISDKAMSKATKKKMETQHPGYPIMLVKTQKNYQWNCIFFVWTPVAGVVLFTFLYFL